MLSSKLAKRYAKGLLDFTEESALTPTVLSEMKAISKAMKENKQLNQFFTTPILDYKTKIKIANEIFTSFSQASKNFINLVIKHGRESYLGAVAKEFTKMVEDKNGVQRITLSTASELSQENIDKILKSSSLVDHNAPHDLKTIVNPDLLGGYILRVGDQQLDTSVRTQLNNIKKEFQLN
ncbi:ATP synthase F1 subunit delta [Riemerella columbipharyngis]|uniref:ATP synthase subunit delta n=1 Tax=Riemerella columbipharyngis TaxID=1071918 RepID=A0A1G7F9X7_9FLAO|nr:ATP synthase F1 subunit delta [Riemerella columbipharyngis]SDE72681.1 F-type H+-transporting ATPase subunit delta [Riemerella columbipharyngis]